MRLTKFPLPPSVNEYLRPLKSTGRFVKTESYKVFEKQVYIWSLRNNALLHDLRLLYVGSKTPLQVDLYFVFHKPRIIKKDGDLKIGRNDSNNFIKPVFDALSKTLGIDDSFFNSQFVERLYCENESDQQVIIDIKDSKIRSLSEFKSS
jgi:Holliday junction resolvase RusA-like endonuclease